VQKEYFEIFYSGYEIGTYFMRVWKTLELEEKMELR
jgi:hypothetical protein